MQYIGSMELLCILCLERMQGIQRIILSGLYFDRTNVVSVAYLALCNQKINLHT